MTDETESFTEYVKKQKKQKQTLSPEREKAVEKAYEKDMNEDAELEEIRDYLGTNSETPNVGTRTRQILMEIAVKLCRKWKTGSYKKWLYWLSLKLNLNVRNVRENYLAVLVETGIIKQNEDGTLQYVGLPKKERKYR
jgi:hypothetical protein